MKSTASPCRPPVGLYDSSIWPRGPIYIRITQKRNGPIEVQMSTSVLRSTFELQWAIQLSCNCERTTSPHQLSFNAQRAKITDSMKSLL